MLGPLKPITSKFPDISSYGEGEQPFLSDGTAERGSSEDLSKQAVISARNMVTSFLQYGNHPLLGGIAQVLGASILSKQRPTFRNLFQEDNRYLSPNKPRNLVLIEGATDVGAA